PLAVIYCGPRRDRVRATADNLRRFVTSILTSGGSASPEAGLVADHLVRANLMGHDSHGVGMIPTYIRHLKAGLVVPNTRATLVPFRGTDARFVTNPVCIAVPGTERHPPLLLDMATSAVAMGKIRVAKNEGKPAPEGALIDAKGKPTRDPNVMYSEPHGAL